MRGRKAGNRQTRQSELVVGIGDAAGDPAEQFTGDGAVFDDRFFQNDLKSIAARVGALCHVEFQIFNPLVQHRDCLLEPPDVGADAVFRFRVLRTQPGQPRDFRVHRSLFNQQRIARRDGFHLGIRQRPRINVFQVPDVRVAGHQPDG